MEIFYYIFQGAAYAECSGARVRSEAMHADMIRCWLGFYSHSRCATAGGLLGAKFRKTSDDVVAF